MAKVEESNDGHVTSMTLDNHAHAQITCVQAEDPERDNMRVGAEVGFMVRVFEPWAVHPGEPDPDGDGFQDGTGTNHDCVSIIVTFWPNGEPLIESVRIDGRHHRPQSAQWAREARARARSAEEVRKRKLAEADALVARAEKLRAEAGAG